MAKRERTERRGESEHMREVEKEATTDEPRNPHGAEDRTLDAISKKRGAPEQFRNEDEEV